MNRKEFITSLVAGGAGVSMLGGLPGCATMNAQQAVIGEPDTSTWEAVRRLFPLTRDRVYLNTGGLGPASQPVLDAMAAQNLRQAVDGETYHSLYQEVREAVARFCNADPEEIALTRNATEANSIIAAGLDLKPGDEVIFESEAHPGGSFPWISRRKLDGIKVRTFQPDRVRGEGNLERIAALINERTRVIQVSHVTAPTGLLFDVPALARLARARGIWLHIDAAQSAGMIPVDMRALECDSFATSGHKWINAPQGTGFLFLKKDRVEEVRPWHVGAYSAMEVTFPDDIRFMEGAPRYEHGTRNAADVLGLKVAIELQEKIGRQRIADHGHQLVRLSRQLMRGLPRVKILTPEDPAMHGSIFTLSVEGIDNSTLGGRFRERGFRVRPVMEDNLDAVRLSWHVYHQQEDVERVAQAAAQIVAS